MKNLNGLVREQNTTKKLKGLVFAAIAAEFVFTAAIAGCSSASENDVKTLCGENVTSIYGAPVYISYVYIIEDTENISAALDCFNSVKLTQDENTAFNAAESLLLTVCGEETTDLFVSPEGEVRLTTASGDVYYSADSTADYPTLYNLLMGYAAD